MSKHGISGRIAALSGTLTAVFLGNHLGCSRIESKGDWEYDAATSTLCDTNHAPRRDAGASNHDVRIHDIQGRRHRSPLEGDSVSDVAGIVTVLRRDGFYLQDPNPDTDDATSEAILVFTGITPKVQVGDAVRVTGRVNEYRPGCSRDCPETDTAFANLTTTEIDRPTRIEVESHDNVLPESTIIGVGGRSVPLTIHGSGSGDVELTEAALDPERNALDFYESLEAMRVTIHDAVVVGPTHEFTGGSSELVVLPDADEFVGLRTIRGGVIEAPVSGNPQRITLTNALVPIPNVDVGARFLGPISGVLGYDFGKFELLSSAPLPPIASSELQPEVTTLRAPKATELTLASFNVENLAATDPKRKFATLASLIVKNLAKPDLIVLDEVQDNDGAIDDGVVDAASTLSHLVSAIADAGGPVYEFRSIDPKDSQDGGEPGGNIRVALLFRNDRGLTFVDRPGAIFDTENQVIDVGGEPTLLYSPGRIEPANIAFAHSRKPLAAEFSFNGAPLFVVAVHGASKLGDQPLFGRFQPPATISETQRVKQAEAVARFVQRIRRIDPQTAIAVMGDFNDSEVSESLGVLKTAGLTSLVENIPPIERYTYIFEGNAQTLDHILVSSSLLDALTGFDIVHVNAEFSSQASDHDPVLARFHLP